jgi:hypothetical protein
VTPRIDITQINKEKQVTSIQPGYYFSSTERYAFRIMPFDGSAPSSLTAHILELERALEHFTMVVQVATRSIEILTLHNRERIIRILFCRNIEEPPSGALILTEGQSMRQWVNC